MANLWYLCEYHILERPESRDDDYGDGNNHEIKRLQGLQQWEHRIQG
jgi:hypothetical protein